MHIADDNPYASPSTPSTGIPDSSPAPGELPIASQGKRLLNLILDSIIIQVLSTAAGFVFGVVYAASSIATSPSIVAEYESTLSILGFLIGLAVTLLYFVATEALLQRTLAKFLTGTIVVTAGGERPSFGQIVARSFVRFIPFEAFSFFGTHPVGLHDSLSGTRVVSVR
jgi:uncharacterized RDD family membrane protein YckC